MRFAPAPAVLDRRPVSHGADPSSGPLSLPAAWAPPPRPPVPIVAAVVPVVGAIGLWLVTGSVMSLWLAALGPLIAAATVADAARSARRDRRRHEAAASRARDRVARAISQRHDVERSRAWTQRPDVARFLAGEDAIWRMTTTERVDELVVGEGDVPSVVRVEGGEGDPSAAALRERASTLAGAPVVIPASAGIVVVGPPVLAAAVQRALAIQVCLALPPGELGVIAPARAEFAWADRLPHARAAATRTLVLADPDQPVPSSADLVVGRSLPGAPLPPRCAAVLEVSSTDSARLRWAGSDTALRVEAISRQQAQAIAEALVTRAERTLGVAAHEGRPIALGTLPYAAASGGGTLSASIGVTGLDPVAVDLVADGPHAVVAGVTGSGKSELLITWILSLARAHTPQQVVFLLADFKGGTAFDSLLSVPHVTGLITDLDGTGARRAIESLRAEIRARESAIAGSGARDIADQRVDLPRLVVVVDEFAALLGDHPELHAVFADVAARGRALGIHLVLGTQRAAGVIRESLLANCPLRISLRVTDAADSRAVLGTADASLLPGGPAGRGQAYVRRAADREPLRVQIALSDESDLVTAADHLPGPPVRRPWLPALPSLLALSDMRERPGDGTGLLLALADEPALQRQTVVGIDVEDGGFLVMGGARSGVSNAIELIAAQAGQRAFRVPADPEGAWDAVATLTNTPPSPGGVICIDDLDSVASVLPPDHARTLLERIEGLVRNARPSGYLVVAGAHRTSAPVLRVAELLPRRLHLAFPTRSEHIGAGADADAFEPDAPPGRGTFDGASVQVALAPAASRPTSRREAAAWQPDSPLTGFVTRRSPASRHVLAEWEARGIRTVSLDAYAADPTSDAEALVLVGEPDDWQRHWRLLADVRGDHDLVVDSSCSAELRLLTGAREIPPYCAPGRARAWLVAAGADPVRIVLPSPQIRPVRPSTHLDRPDAAP